MKPLKACFSEVDVGGGGRRKQGVSVLSRVLNRSVILHTPLFLHLTTESVFLLYLPQLPGLHVVPSPVGGKQTVQFDSNLHSVIIKTVWIQIPSTSTKTS